MLVAVTVAYLYTGVTIVVTHGWSMGGDGVLQFPQVQEFACNENSVDCKLGWKMKFATQT